MGIFYSSSEKPVTEGFAALCENLGTIDSEIIYTESAIPVFRSTDTHLVEYSMLSKLAKSNAYDMLEAFDKVCYENDLAKDNLTVLADEDDISTDVKVEEFTLFLVEAWKNDVSVKMSDHSDKVVKVNANGSTMYVHVKNIDKQIAKCQKELDKANDRLKWWNSLTDEQKRSERTKQKVIHYVMLAGSAIGLLIGSATVKSNPVISIASSLLSIGLSTGIMIQPLTKKGAAIADTDSAVEANGEKIYKNSGDYFKRVADMWEKIIKALEDYKKKNNL